MHDTYTKFTVVEVLTITASKANLQAFKRLWIQIFGIPDEVVSDNGTYFSSREWRDEMQRLGINHILIPPRSPQTNGAVERMVGILKAKFRHIHHDQTIEWKEWIYLLCLSYNLEIHSITGCTQYELMMGVGNFLTDYKGAKINILSDDELHQKLQDATRSYSKRNYHSKIEVGDTVLTRNLKPSLFVPNFEEEMTVLEKNETFVREWRKPLKEVRKKR